MTKAGQVQKKDHLIKDSLILFIASSAVNASNFIFHMYALRNMQSADYGVLATLLGVIMILTMPSYSLQLMIANKTAAYKVKNRTGAIGQLFKFATFWFFILGILAFAGLAAFSGLIKSFFRIEDTGLVYILAGIAMISFVISAVRGVLQGMQKFVGFGLNLVADALLRLFFLVIFLVSGWGVRGALSTTLCSVAAAYILGVFMIRGIFRHGDEETQVIRKRDLLGYAMPVFLAYLGFSLLSYMDLFMVKHFFGKEQAGLYAVTSIIGKAFLFFPSAIVLALFPKVSEHRELNKNAGSMLLKSIGLTAAASSAGIIFCYIFPGFVLRLLTGGEKYFGIINVARIFGMAILPLVLLNVIISYSLAMHKYGIIYALYGGIALYAGLLWVFHSNFYTVLAVLFGVNLFILALSVFGLRPWKNAEGAV